MLKLQQKFKTMQNEFEEFLKNFLLQQALDALNKTKEYTPVSQGQLRSAWTLSGVQRQGNAFLVTLHNPLQYASSVEYGYLTPDHTSWIEGKFMCTLALDEVEKRVPGRFQTAFKSWVKGV